MKREKQKAAVFNVSPLDLFASRHAQQRLRSRSSGFYPIYRTHTHTHTARLPDAPWHPLNASHGRLHERRHSINKPEAQTARQTTCVCVCVSHRGTYSSTQTRHTDTFGIIMRSLDMSAHGHRLLSDRRVKDRR